MRLLKHENVQSSVEDFYTEEKMKKIFDAISDFVFVLDKNSRFVRVNKATCDFLKKEPKELIGKRCFEVLHGTDKPWPNCPCKKMSVTKETETEEINDSNLGIALLVTASPIFDDKGEHIGCVHVAKDITERKKAEEALRESEEKFRNLAEQSPNMIFINKKGRIVYANKKCEEIMGYKKEKFYSPDFDFLTLIEPEFKDLVKTSFNRHMKGEEVAPYEYALVTKEGKRIEIMNTTTLIKYEGESAILGILTDITTRKQMEKKLEEYSQQLEELVEKRTRQLKEAQEQLLKSERLAAIGEVAAMVGHDLRNPLTGIAGATYYLKTKFGPKIDKKTKEMLELIEKDIEYSNKIINGLLDYSKEIRLELIETTPKSIIKDALTLVKVPKNIQILDLTENKPKIEMDVQKMKRVFVNIIKNTVDAMPEGGKLTITSNESNGNLEIAFTDTGTGIPKDIVEKIWTPLFTTKAKGMGLGLSICKRIVEAHRGSISVESTVGKGVTFTVTLPTKPKIEGGEKTWVNVPESLLLTTTKA